MPVPLGGTSDQKVGSVVIQNVAPPGLRPGQ